MFIFYLFQIFEFKIERKRLKTAVDLIRILTLTVRESTTILTTKVYPRTLEEKNICSGRRPIS